MPPTPLLLDTNEAARLLGLSARKLRALINAGEIPAVKIDRCKRVCAADLETYVKNLGAA